MGKNPKQPNILSSTSGKEGRRTVIHGRVTRDTTVKKQNKDGK